MVIRRFLTGALLFAALVSAQSAFEFRDWKPPASASAKTPTLPCTELRSLTAEAVTIITAAVVPAAGDRPEYCRVSGQILPEVSFLVDLPADWNGRLYMFGNGGYAGEQLDSPGRNAASMRAVRLGFAVAQTDTGHSAASEPLGSFATNRQKLLDYAFRSLHLTAAIAKALARAYYSAPPARAYFDGCSTGGREGLILAQRFPADFDGIVVGAPVLNFSGTMVSYARMAQALAVATIPTTKLELLANRIYAQCDAKDGLADGVIDDPRRCLFQPSRDLPQCDTGSDRPDCFTAGQIAALTTIYADVISQGKRIFPGWPVGAEVAGLNGQSGWDPWIVHDGSAPISVSFARSFFGFLAFPQKDPQYDLSRFDLGKDPPRLEAIHQLLDATDTDLTAFQRRGGKILMYFGWADPALNPLMGVEYYEKVSQQTGGSSDQFFRLFMVPGMFHCGGGVGVSAFDAATPLVNWVENGVAPDGILASRVSAGKVDRTRPLCAYPEVAKYKGTGSIDDAANFTCVKP